jgi:murein DD-endopeptidase MepM/ murein hydrolase activator NlpD
MGLPPPSHAEPLPQGIARGGSRHPNHARRRPELTVVLSLAFAAPCCGLAPGALVAQNARLQGIQCGLAPSRFADEVVLPLLPEGGKNWQVTNRFGNVVTSRDVVGLPPGQWQHTGVDYVLGGSTEASGDQTVHAIAAGTVVFSTASAANPVPRRGGLVVVHHVAAGDREFQVPAWTNPSGASGYPPSTTRNFYSYYLHLSPEGLAAQGKVVEAGEEIGHTYSRAEQLRLGLAYPPHLHLEVWTQCVEADRNGYDSPGPEFTSGLGNPEVDAAAFLMENAWATLPNGTEDKERQVTFRADGTVLAGVVPLTRVREPVDVSGASVLVSPPAVLRGYQVILVVDPDVGAREAYLLGEGLPNPRNLLPQGWAVQLLAQLVTGGPLWAAARRG